jgi:hypothetical protein
MISNDSCSRFAVRIFCGGHLSGRSTLQAARAIACEARSSRVVDESSPCHPFACRTGWMLPETRLSTAMCRLVSIKPSANFHGVLYNRFVR